MIPEARKNPPSVILSRTCLPSRREWPPVGVKRETTGRLLLQQSQFPAPNQQQQQPFLWWVTLWTKKATLALMCKQANLIDWLLPITHNWTILRPVTLLIDLLMKQMPWCCFRARAHGIMTRIRPWCLTLYSSFDFTVTESTCEICHNHNFLHGRHKLYMIWECSV